MSIERTKQILKNFKNFVKSNPENLSTIKEFLNQIEKNLNSSFLIFENILDILHSTQVSPEVKKFLLERAAEICEKNFEFKKALNIYRNLAKNYPEERYLKKIKLFERLKEFDRLKFVLKKHGVSLEIFIKLYERSRISGESIESLLIKELKIPKKELLASIEEYYDGIPAFDLKAIKQFKKVPRVLEVKRQFFEDNLCIPLIYQNTTYLITYHPEDFDKIEEVKKILQIPSMEIKVAFALKEDILEVINRYFSIPYLEQVDFFEEEEELEAEEVKDEKLIDNTIVQLVNSIIEEAYHMRASDIHWESLSEKRGLQVRFRIDGECMVYNIIPHSQKNAVISRIKIMANLDIAEKRLPQDGKIKFRTKDGKTFELRVATIPTVENNEDVVMRILGGMELRSLEEIDLLPEIYQKFKKILDLPYGLILAVGPTGSGKTTTLHAALQYLNKPNKKIWTAEDPVEIVQEGLRQVQVNPKIGLTFSRVLRAFLRADPDIIMIGETRDHETAHTLIEASLTGHLVLSTLHTNSAPETVTRLLGMGIDPYNFADALLGILAQRLAKRLCPECKEPYTPSEEEIERLIKAYGHHPVKPLTEELIKKGKFFKPAGCSACNYTGFKGRVAIHELLVPDEDLKRLIIKNAPAAQIRDAAIEKGFLTLKQDGILKVLRGDTTLAEINRVTLR